MSSKTSTKTSTKTSKTSKPKKSKQVTYTLTKKVNKSKKIQKITVANNKREKEKVKRLKKLTAESEKAQKKLTSYQNKLYRQKQKTTTHKNKFDLDLERSLLKKYKRDYNLLNNKRERLHDAVVKKASKVKVQLTDDGGKIFSSSEYRNMLNTYDPNKAYKFTILMTIQYIQDEPDSFGSGQSVSTGEIRTILISPGLNLADQGIDSSEFNIIAIQSKS